MPYRPSSNPSRRGTVRVRRRCGFPRVGRGTAARAWPADKASTDRWQPCLLAAAPSAAAARRLGRIDGYHPAVDEDMTDARRLVEEIAARDDHVGDLALLERAHAIAGAGDL